MLNFYITILLSKSTVNAERQEVNALNGHTSPFYRYLAGLRMWLWGTTATSHEHDFSSDTIFGKDLLKLNIYSCNIVATI